MYDDNEFRVDTYITKEVPDELKDTEYARKLDSAICKGVQRPSSEQDLEDQYRDFLDQPLDLRRMANHLSREVYGRTNDERYIEYRAHFLNQDSNLGVDSKDIVIGSSGGIREEVEDFTKLDHSEMDPITQDKIDQAKAFMNDTYWVIIIPTKTLDALEQDWVRFTSLTMKQRRLCDSKSIEIFGCTNQNMYELLKGEFLKHNIGDEMEITSDIVESVNNILKQTQLSEYDKCITELGIYDIDEDRVNIISSILKLEGMNLSGQESIKADRAIKDIISSYEGEPEITDNPIIHLPFFDPIEISSMTDMEFDKPITNIDDFEMDGLKVGEWWNSYCLEFFGFHNQSYIENSVKWAEFVRKESYKYNNPSNEEAKRKSEKKLLQVGWNPDIEYTPVSAMKAAERTKAKMETIRTTGSVVDLTGFDVSPSVYSEAVKNDIPVKTYGKDKDLYPVYIVLVEGNSIFSKAIKSFTKGPFSHAAIGFDSSLERLYSYNLSTKYTKDISGKKNNGFSIEGINKYNKGTRIGVYTIFVKEKEYNKMRSIVDLYMGSKTHYSLGNIFRIVFNIPTKGTLNMICSQFVDNLLKVTDIDITGKISNLVNPNDFFVKAKTNKRIYKVYDGACKDYKKSKTDAIFRSMNKTNRISYVKEALEYLGISEIGDIKYNKSFDSSPLLQEVYESVVKPITEINIVCEAKKFPVQFNKDGDLLIHNMYNLSFDGEWDLSHRLLKEYADSGNIEGIKYELAKLWFLSKLLSKRISHKSFIGEKKANIDRRARILNDFNKYMKVAIKLDPSFNFTKYYNDTPFSDATIQIDASTLKYTGEYLKRLVSGII